MLMKVNSAGYVQSVMVFREVGTKNGGETVNNTFSSQKGRSMKLERRREES